MNSRNFAIVAILSASQMALPAFARAEAPRSDQSATFQVTDKTDIPGRTIKPGSYTVRLVDHLSDRMIVQIQDAKGDVKETFLGVPAGDHLSASQPGPVLFNGGKKHNALRGFSFQDGTSVEFVYPKNDAVALAKDSNTTVLAIDPASEGRPALKGLSSDDLKMVSLWMLTPTPVGPGNGKVGIQAAHYQAPAVASTNATEVASSAPSTVDSTQPQAPSQARSKVRSSVGTSSRSTSDNTLRAEVKPPVIQRLPKTASMMPLLNMAALCSMILAACLSFARLRAKQN